MKRAVAVILLLTLFLLSGCDMFLGTGTLSVDANDVDSIRVESQFDGGSTFTIEDRDTIRTIVNHINSYELDTAAENTRSYIYTLSLLDSDGAEVLQFTVVDDTSVSTGGASYTVNATALRQYVEARECDTMNDEELIRYLFESDTMADLNILDENGQISLDKITGLVSSCPALFELLSRPSAIESVGSYGLDMLQEAMDSTNIDIREQAENIGEILKNLLPGLSEQINNILEQFSQNP